MENLRLAWLKARRGKRGKCEVIDFGRNLDANLASLREDLLAGCVRVGEYHYFTIKDPKERLICAASLRERVLHHAIMNVCEPVFERALIDQTYACRNGKGRLKALEQAREYAHRYRYFLKLDIRKYFDSVDHGVLQAMLERKFKDRTLLDLFGRIIDSYQTGEDRGIPIGNLTSQHFANSYLGFVDHFVKESLRIPAYVRYMDDMALWSDEREELKAGLKKLGCFLGDVLRLQIKEHPYLNRTRHGMEFLGFRVLPDRFLVGRRAGRRFVRRVRGITRDAEAGVLPEWEAQSRLTSMTAFVAQADSLEWCRRYLDFGKYPMGLEPRQSWRQLEQ